METEQKDPQRKLKWAAYMFLLMIVISFLTDFFGKDRLFTLIATWAVGAFFCWMLLRPKGFDKLGYPQQKALRWPAVAGVISALLLVTFTINKSLIEKKNLTAQEVATDLAKKVEQENIAAEVSTLNTQARSEEPVEEVGDWNFLLNRCIPMSTNENCDIESVRRKAAQWDGKSTIDLHMAYRVYQNDSFEFRNFRFFRESSWPQTVPVIKKDTLTFTPARYKKGRGGELYVTYLYENNCEVEYKYIKISDTEVDSYNTRVSATCSDTWHDGFEMLAGKAIRHTLLKI